VEDYDRWMAAFCTNMEHPPMHGIFENCPNADAQNDISGLKQKLEEIFSAFTLNPSIVVCSNYLID
jgi:hypothetical protein